MARLTRADSSDEDDYLDNINSKVANQSIHNAASPAAGTPSRPGQPPSAEIVDLTHSPEPARGYKSLNSLSIGHSDKPVFGKPGKLMSSLKQKAAGASQMFIQPKNRPELHRERNVPPPRNPAKAAPPTFSSLSPQAHPPEYVQSSYYRGAPTEAAFEDNTFYTDPVKANEDLKALLEGGLEDDEEEENKGDLDDGTLEGVKVKLLPHQVEGVKWMKGRELGPVKRGKVPKGGILADDMGLGKTLQSISLILSNPRPDRDHPDWKKSLNGVERGTLVVAPLALIRQWEAEIQEKVTKSHRLSVCVHHGPNRTKRFQDLAKYDVVITTYQILVSEFNYTSETVKAGCFGLHWYRVILDEAHTIKNRNAKSTKACCALRSEFRWCLTGTPMQNNLDELQSLVNFLRIQPYDNLQHWRENIDKPMKNGKGHLAIRRLHALLRSFMKRRTKDILKEEGALLPGGKKALEEAAKNGSGEAPVSKFKITERKVVAVSTEFSASERRFYNKLEERADKSLEAMMKQKVNYANALVLLLRLRQACNHPSLVGSKLDKDKDALSTDTSAQKNADTSVDDLADALGGMGIQAKKCELCMVDLPRDVSARGQEHCDECLANMDEVNAEFTGENKTKKKAKKPKKHARKAEDHKRKPRRRNVVIDSDDEDEEGSWLVGEDQRGSLRLGKAGGTDDEDAEGTGEDIGSDDSIHHSESEAGSHLDSFVVDDEVNTQTTYDDGSDDDSFVSLDKFGSQPMKSRNQRKPVTRVESESESESESQTDSEDEDSGVSESELEKTEILYTPHKAAKSKKHLMNSSKIREIVKILHKEAPEHKFIVFSQFTSMLDLVEPYLRKEGFKFVRYDGGMKNDAREESLNRLRNDKNTRILLCSLKCGSLGLNLTAATRVIIIEPFWNPFVEEQAIDRVHRLTQTVDVIVYKLTVKGTVEERILKLQEKKRLLAQHAIEGGMKKNKDSLKLSLQDLLNLFKPRADEGGQRGGGEGGEDDDDALNGLADFRSKKPRAPKKAPRREDDVYGRRW
ncbi:DNA repair protein RAD16 [Diaporthe helianthi]|uniref:DNA repair protein RAD16 n=1 Tax=Diaporthe helianthi TaxID=158607 RepID=A0A2P5I666_DIAHE|nr:DNA repair protein RAD16 [Diaporthe helianthi]